MSSSSLGSRRKTAYAARRAAKQRRQRNIAIAGFIVLIALAAYEIPNTVKHFGGSNSPTAAPVTTTPTVPRSSKKPLAHLPKTVTSDPFATRSFASADPSVGPETGGHDPFKPFASEQTPSSVSAAQPLPQTIVLGAPGKGRAATHGWIVIMASIPTAEGKASADAFARRAGSTIGKLAILNSSNRKPLRGGYWVVYSGPYKTLGEVSGRASSIHAAGYPSAYIRQLIVYS